MLQLFKKAVSFGLATLAVFGSLFVNIPIASSADVHLFDHITITPAYSNIDLGETVQLTAVAYDDANGILDADFDWQVVGGPGSINASGIYTGSGLGVATIHASTVINDIYRVADAVVKVSGVTIADERVLSWVEIIPGTINTQPNGQVQLQARAHDQYNDSLPGLAVTWSIVNGGGSINANGLFTAGNSVGTFVNTVRASVTYKGVTHSGYATVVVSNPTTTRVLTRVEIEPSATTVQRNASIDFNAVAYDQYNVPIIGVPLTWSVIYGGGSIGSTGLFTAGSVNGVFSNTVKAAVSYNGVTLNDYATVTVADTVVNPNPFLSSSLGVTVNYAAKTTANEGDTLRYILTLKNIGQTTAYNVRASLPISNFVYFQSVTSTAGMAGISGNNAVWSGFSLLPNEERQLTLTVSVKNNLAKGTHYLNQKADISFDRLTTGDHQSFSIPAATITVGASGAVTTGGGSTTLPETGPWAFVLTAVLALGATILTRKYLATRSAVWVENYWL